MRLGSQFLFLCFMGGFSLAYFDSMNATTIHDWASSHFRIDISNDIKRFSFFKYITKLTNFIFLYMINFLVSSYHGPSDIARRVKSDLIAEITLRKITRKYKQTRLESPLFSEGSSLQETLLICQRLPHIVYQTHICRT